MNLGYCCINMTLRSNKPSVYSSRSIIRQNFNLQLASTRGLQNVQDILTILKWNDQHNIKCFRIGSEPLPRAGDMTCGYTINELPNAQLIKNHLSSIGEYAVANQHNLSFHPGQYVCIGSPNDMVRKLGIYALEKENECADLIGHELDIPINIHIGGSYGCDYVATAKRFIESFNKLSPSLQKRLTVENDDKANCWGVRQLYELIYKETHIPICFDFHHWLFKNDGHNIREDFELAYSTWGNRSMQVHYSQSPTSNKLIPAHSDYYRDPLPSWVSEYNCHIHLEAKAKELALLDYRNKFLFKG